ncbi:pyrroline 5-carboyxlate reductase [Anticarsia gemmatalis]|uniref:pyrroline 5-carboyxlate reductase n=1 Tax=Anticarsia gemmatalis TaxID=129554 RepID=UPI003F761414
MSFNLGFIGGGNMSTAIFKGILKGGAHPANNICVSGPHIENLKHWKDLGANTTDDNGIVFDNCDIIFIGVKVDKLDTALKTINRSSSKKKVLFVSMLAGKKLVTLKQAISFYLPNAEISVTRIMPNTPMTVGTGICLYTPDATVTEQQCQLLEKLLNSSALCERVPEPLMDSLGTLTACGPAFMYLVIEALADGAVKQGVPRAMATRHAAQMVVGSGQMVLQTGKHPGLLKDEVCSPGGSTICGISALENGGLRATMINAIEAATHKNKDLGK